MKRMGMLFAVALLAATLLAGCVIVPYGGWYGEGYGYRPHHYYRPYPHDYYYR